MLGVVPVPVEGLVVVFGLVVTVAEVLAPGRTVVVGSVVAGRCPPPATVGPVNPS